MPDPIPSGSGSNPTALKIGRRIIHAPSGQVSLSDKFCNTICGMILEKRRLYLPSGATIGKSWVENHYAENCCTDRITTTCCDRTIATTIKCDYSGSGDCSCVGSGTLDLVWNSTNECWEATIDAASCSSSTVTVRFYCDPDTNGWKLAVTCENGFSSSTQTLDPFSEQDCTLYTLNEDFATSGGLSPCCFTGSMTFTVYDPSMSDASTTDGIQVSYTRIHLPAGWTVGQEFCTTANDACCEERGPCDCEDESATPINKQPSVAYLLFLAPDCPYLDGVTLKMNVITDAGPYYCSYASECPNVLLDGAGTWLGQAVWNYNGIIGGLELVQVEILCYRNADCWKWPSIANLNFGLTLISCDPFYAEANVTIDLPQVTTDCNSAANLCTFVPVTVVLFE